MALCKTIPNLKCKSPITCKMYRCNFNRISPENCKHPSATILVLEATVTCEKTALKCDYCNALLTKPKTDCL